MTPQQIDMLIHGFENAAGIVAWIVGISTTVIIGLITVSVTLIYKAWSKRLEEVYDVANDAVQAVDKLTKNAADTASHCREMRSQCREQLLERVRNCPTINSFHDMDLDHKELIEKAVNGVAVKVIENRDFIASKLEKLTLSHEKFKDEIWKALHSHRHTSDNGRVIRGDT